MSLAYFWFKVVSFCVCVLLWCWFCRGEFKIGFKTLARGQHKESRVFTTLRSFSTTCTLLHYSVYPSSVLLYNSIWDFTVHYIYLHTSVSWYIILQLVVYLDGQNWATTRGPPLLQNRQYQQYDDVWWIMTILSIRLLSGSIWFLCDHALLVYGLYLRLDIANNTCQHWSHGASLVTRRPTRRTKVR